jgi:hypothetical protein
MRIAKTDLIAGLPASAARQFLRRVKNDEFEEEWALSLLDTPDIDKPSTTLGLFKAQGYIERTGNPDGRYLWWRTTILGNALAMASFGRPISRRTAERLVAEMLERARDYNSDSSKPYYVQRLRVFGSYLDKTIDRPPSAPAVRSRQRSNVPDFHGPADVAPKGNRANPAQSLCVHQYHPGGHRTDH